MRMPLLDSTQLEDGSEGWSAATLLGRRVALRADIDSLEATRRLNAGLGAVTDRDLIEVLFELPELKPIEWRWLDARARRTLLEAPSGIITYDAESVRRVARPPLSNVGVVVAGSDVRCLLTAAGSFAPFAQRWICLPEDGLAEVELEASLYRVGVIRIRDGEAVETYAPPPFLPERWTAALWRFWELTFRAMIGASALSHIVQASKFRG